VVASLHALVDPRTDVNEIVPSLRAILAKRGVQFSTIEIVKDDARGKSFRISSLLFSGHGGGWANDNRWPVKPSLPAVRDEDSKSMEIML
jgi:hypothetical protein